MLSIFVTVTSKHYLEWLWMTKKFSEFHLLSGSFREHSHIAYQKKYYALISLTFDFNREPVLQTGDVEFVAFIWKGGSNNRSRICISSNSLDACTRSVAISIRCCDFMETILSTMYFTFRARTYIPLNSECCTTRQILGASTTQHNAKNGCFYTDNLPLLSLPRLTSNTVNILIPSSVHTNIHWGLDRQACGSMLYDNALEISALFTILLTMTLFRCCRVNVLTQHSNDRHV